MKSDRETWCKNTSNELKNCQKTRCYPNYAPKHVWICRSWTILLCSSITERTEDPIFMPRICTTSRRRTGKLCKRVDQKQRTIRPCLGGKCVQNNQTTSWIKVVSGVEKYVREAMPIQEREELRGDPLQRLNQYWQQSKDQPCYQMSKFMTNLLRHREVGRGKNAGGPYDRII